MNNSVGHDLFKSEKISSKFSGWKTMGALNRYVSYLMTRRTELKENFEAAVSETFFKIRSS